MPSGPHAQRPAARGDSASYQRSHSRAASAPSRQRRGGAAGCGRPASRAGPGRAAPLDRAGQAVGVADRRPAAPTPSTRPGSPPASLATTGSAGRHRLLDDERPGLPGAGQDEDVRGRAAGRATSVAGTDQLDRGAGTRIRSSRPRAQVGRRPRRPPSGTARRQAAAASTSVGRSFCGAIRETVSTSGRSAPSRPPSRAARRSRGPARRSSSTGGGQQRGHLGRGDTARAARRAAPSARACSTRSRAGAGDQVGAPGDQPLRRGLDPAQPGAREHEVVLADDDRRRAGRSTESSGGEQPGLVAVRVHDVGAGHQRAAAAAGRAGGHGGAGGRGGHQVRASCPAEPLRR